MNSRVAAPVFQTDAGIDRISAEHLSQSRFIQDYFLKNRPVIIENAIGHWPSARWNLDTIKADIPDQKVRVRNNINGKLFDTQTMSQTITEMQLHSFIDLIQSGNNPTPMYLAQTPFRRLVANPADFITRFPYMRRGDYLMQTNVWIGTPGLVTPAHFDFTHNFYMQVCGHKNITLFSPEDSAFLYPNPKFPVVSQVDVGQPDLNTYPEFPNANPIRFMIGPGDSVFIPAHWWHYITSSHDNNIAINQWFLRIWSRNLAQAKMVPPLLSLTARSLLGLNK